LLTVLHQHHSTLVAFNGGEIISQGAILCIVGVIW